MIWRVFSGMKPATSPPRIAQAWFYDLNTGDLFLAPADSEDPIRTTSGDFEGHPAGVRAMVFSCGSCNKADERFVGWLEMPDPGLSARQIDVAESLPGEDAPSGLLIRSEKGDQWYPFESVEAAAIMQAAQSVCREGEQLRPCMAPSAMDR